MADPISAALLYAGMSASTAATIGTIASTVGTIGTIASTVMGAVGARNAGISANKEAQYRAQQAEVQAGQERASAQRASVEQIRQLRIQQSRGQALAAASGGGALDASVMDILGDLEEKGQYKAATAAYQGEDSARNLETNATLSRYSGKQAQSAGNIKALTTIASGATDLYTKYDNENQSNRIIWN